MRWNLLHGRLSKDLHFFCRVRHASTNDYYGITERYNLSKVWSRYPPRLPTILPPNEQPYYISRNGDSTLSRINYSLIPLSLDVCIKDGNKNLRFPFREMDFLKWLWMLNYHYLFVGSQLPLVNDLLAGCRQVFLTIIGAIIKRDLASLNEFTLGSGNTLRGIKSSLNSVSNTELDRLKVSSKDFIGKNGLCQNYNATNLFDGTASRFIHQLKFTNKYADGTPLDGFYLVYTVYVATLLKKDFVYSMVRPLPYTESKERAVNFLPKSYGYKTPKYTVMKLSMCHKVSISPYLLPQLAKDSMIYDFEIHSF